MTRTLASRPIRYLIVILIFTLIWIGFGPVQLGGAVSYIIINGNSMEPDFEVGDLVIARKGDLYELDQRVIYQHPQFGYVFHRIVDKNDERFILQGDNNDWLDSYQPDSSEIVGRYWFGLPRAGRLILLLRQPLFFSVLLVALFSVTAYLFFFSEKAPGKRKGKRHRMKQEKPSQTSSDFRLEVLIIILLMAGLAIFAAFASFSKDEMILVEDNLHFSHQAQLAYSVSESISIYDRSGVESGDPIYPAVNCVVELDFSYLFSSPRLTKQDLSVYANTFSLWVEIRDNDGWNRTFMLIPDYKFEGNSIQAESSLNICRILDRIAEKESITGVEIKNYSLTILPELNINGMLFGNELHDEFIPEFRFDLSDSVFRVAPSSEGFNIMKEGEIPHSFEVQNFMTILGRQFEVLTMRKASLILLGLCVLGAAYPAWSLFQDLRTSQRKLIDIQHRPLIIDLEGPAFKTKGLTLVDLANISDLRKLADRYGAMIMHESAGDIDRYFVVDDGYLYQVTVEEDLPSLTGNEGDKKKEK